MHRKKRQVFVWPSENWRSGTSDHQKKTGITRPRHGAIIPRRCSPFPQSAKYISRSLKIGALACVVKDAMNIWLAEQKPEVWSK